MQARKIADEIRAAFRPPFIVATTPDLPHLISSPDFLIGGHGRLYGIFCLKAEEVRQPSLLLSRLAISRLGLPDMVCTLVTDGTDISPITESLWKDNFDFIAESGSIRQTATQFRDFSPQRVIQQQTREATLFRYNHAFAETKGRGSQVGVMSDPVAMLEDLRNKQGYHFTETRQWSGALNPRFSTLQIRQNVSVSAQKFEPRVSPLRLLRRHSYRAMNHDYVLDDSVPYIEHLNINIILVDRLPLYRLDPSKPARASAFAGIVLTTVTSLDDVERVSEKLDAAIKSQLQ